MRFAYIDSQGNEVPIPSVDALALRIELGAISPETQLYDAQADRWGPAESHEIFHTLSRDAAEEGGFVAPPPPVAPPQDLVGEPPSPDGPTVDLLAPEPEVELEPEAEPEPELEPEPAPSPEPDMGGLDLDFTFTDAGADNLQSEPEAEPEEPEPADETPTGEAPADDPQAGAFDFGAPLELEEPLAEEPHLIADLESEPPIELGGGMELEAPLSDAMDFSGVEAGGTDMELEAPMSEFSSDAPPSWMEQDGPAGLEEDPEVMSFPAEDDLGFGPADEDIGAAPVPPPDERPDPRPSPPSRRPPRRKPAKTSLAGPIMGVLALVVIGAGGWFGWQAFVAGGGGDDDGADTVVLPEVTLPDIPADLMPLMQELGETALSETIVELDSMLSRLALPAEPRDEWLAGIYLANASRYADIEEYWLAIDDFVDRLRDVDTRIFRAQYQEEIDSAGVDAETASLLMARADSGFLSTRDLRFEAYNEMDDLVNAAMNLHAFLLTNEADIAYTPAAGGVSGDPVLEAVPASSELGDSMWDMVDAITEALDILGTLDRVTTERLATVLLERIREAGFR